MKQLLLLAIILFTVSSLSAQLQRSATVMKPAQPQLQLTKHEVREAQMRTPGTPLAKAPSKADNVEVWYNRPAGALPAFLVVEDGAYTGYYQAPYYAITPYIDYTFHGHAIGLSDDVTYVWDYEHDIPTEDGSSTEKVWDTFYGQDLTIHYGDEVDEVPAFSVVGSSGYTYTFDLRFSGDKVSSILSVPSTMAKWNRNFLKSSKSFSATGRNGDQRYPMTYYSGAKPYDPRGEEGSGYWFGKNGGTNGGSRVDGIAQAFEKPTYPYLLKQVVVDCGVLDVVAPVEMTCKVYKLDEIPAYLDGDEAILPEVPGELIATGRASLTPETATETGNLIFFTLYGEEDGLEYDFTPTIDCPILVVVDGYNEPEMANLTDFTAMISSDIHIDEGYGELAYLKLGINDENGNFDHYVWAGLNNFFTSGEMKTGLTIFLSTENPYLTFSNDEEDGEYLFPAEGGLMEKQLGAHTCRSIEFRSWTPSADDSWYVSCNDEDVPGWLNIELADEMQDDQFTGLVNAEVTADPLPAGVNYREAIVRFGYPGAYVDYKFMQGVKYDGIEEVATPSGNVVPVGYYDIMGRQYNSLQNGVNIVKMSDGSAKKILKM